MDPPDHTQMRKLIARRFTPAPHRRARAARPGVDERAARLASTAVDEFDVVHEFTALLPDHRRRHACSASPPTGTTTPASGPTTCSPESRATRCRRGRRPRGRCRSRCWRTSSRRARRERPADDILSTLVRGRDRRRAAHRRAGDRLLPAADHRWPRDHVEADRQRHPPLRDPSRPARRGHRPTPTLMVGAVEELLRFTSPTQYMARTSPAPVELHGVGDAGRGQGGAAARLRQP